LLNNIHALETILLLLIGLKIKSLATCIMVLQHSWSSTDPQQHFQSEVHENLYAL
jgi:hypothetical protein